MASDEKQIGSPSRVRWGNWVLLPLILAGAGGIAYAWLGLPDTFLAKGLIYVRPTLPTAPYDLTERYLPLDVLNRLVAEEAECLKQD